MLNEISLLGQSSSWLEVIAMLTGILGVWLTMKQNPLCFPVGIINVSLYAWLFFSPGIRLYADALLQCIYILLLIYGWYKWTIKEKSSALLPIRIGRRNSMQAGALVFAGTIVLAFFLQTQTDASYPWLDSALTCFSLAAQWMIARKMIENWIVWIVVDIVYLPLYIIKGLPLTALLYFIFLLLAIRGYVDWKKQLVYER